MAFPPSTLFPYGIRHGIRHCPGGDDPAPCLDWGLGGKTYYVDPVNGSDTYDGLSPFWTGGLHGPWQTLTYAFSAASPLGVATAGVKGAYHDYLVGLPGIYEALETWPLTIPATKNSIHVVGSAMPHFNSPIIGTLGAYTTAHATEPTLIIEGKDVSIEGFKIIGPTGDFPVIRVNEDLAVLRHNWIRGRDDGGDGINFPAAAAAFFSLVEHNWIDCYVDTAVAVEIAQQSITLLNNRIQADNCGGVNLLDEAHWCKILWNRIYNAMADYTMDYGIALQAGAIQNELDENRIGAATAGVSGVQRRIYDLAQVGSNWFGRNWQLGSYQAGPPAGINRAGDPITDGGVGSGYSTD